MQDQFHKNLKGWRSGAAWLLILATLLAALGCSASQIAPPVTDPTFSTEVTIVTSPATETTTIPTDGSEATEEPSTSPSTEATSPATEATTPTTEATTPSTEATEAPTQPTTAPTEPTVPSVPATQPTTPPTQPTEPVAPGSSFEVHFIDVGQADAMLIICDGKTMLIDGGNAEDSNLMYTYLKKYNITHLDYVIATHVHEDHVGGISGALRYASVGIAYCPATSYSTNAFKNFVSALNRYNVSITVPKKGFTFNLGSAVCTVLAVNTDSTDRNNTSIVLRVVYGETSFLFAGDAEQEVEDMLLSSGINLKSTVLKVGHHGSSSSTGYYWLRQIAPEYAVIQVGSDNTYGHPTSAVLSRLRDADVTTFRTDIHGDIICVSDGKTVTFTPSKNINADPFPELK